MAGGVWRILEGSFSKAPFEGQSYARVFVYVTLRLPRAV
jgi:hypothetical protein